MLKAILNHFLVSMVVQESWAKLTHQKLGRSFSDPILPGFHPHFLVVTASHLFYASQKDSMLLLVILTTHGTL